MPVACLGRSALLASVEQALGGSAWVSLVGPPGSGKTLLARHSVAERAPVAWVPAARLDRVDGVVASVLRVLGVQETPGDDPRTALTMALGARPTTLVLDGVRDDTDGLGEVLAEVAESIGDSRVLCTAHTVAGALGEHVVRVGPLPVPRAGEPLEGPAYEVFSTALVRAGSTRRSLEGRDDDEVRRLLAATGGLPLLLEQVAVQVALTGTASIVGSRGLDDYVRVSYALLDEDTRRCFRRLACLPGPASLLVIHHVAGTPDLAECARLVSELARRSLLEIGPDGRIDLLPPIRLLGERLRTEPDREAARRGLLAWAESVVPADPNSGAADAPWLLDLPMMTAAVARGAREPATLPRAYDLANRAFSSLYTSMQTRAAVDLLGAVLEGGDGPPGIGAQVARRAGIASSEVEGTYAGLPLLDRSDAQASAAAHPVTEHARNASIRAEMHLDAARFADAEAEALRVLDLGTGDDAAELQALRTIADLNISRGDLAQGRRYAGLILERATEPDEMWIALSADTLLGRIALEQGRVAEAAAAARDVVARAAAAGEDRVAVLADVLLRQAEPGPPSVPTDLDALPWSIRLPVLIADARVLWLGGEVARAAGLAADVVVLADRVRLGREAVSARLLLAQCTAALGDHRQAAATLLATLEGAVAAPLPLLAADALDALAVVAGGPDPHLGADLAATAADLRASRSAAPWGGAVVLHSPAAAGAVPPGWVVAGQLTRAALDEIGTALDRRRETTATGRGESPARGPLATLTRTERLVALKVAEGLTSRQIAAELFVSPRTVDAHLTHIYRKLDISSRARLAAIVTDAS